MSRCSVAVRMVMMMSRKRRRRRRMIITAVVFVEGDLMGKWSPALLALSRGDNDCPSMYCTPYILYI